MRTPRSGPSPDIPASSYEIGQVRDAFAAVQQTAVRAAVGQARLRQGMSEVFRNLAWRSQSLLHRQLALLDRMTTLLRSRAEAAIAAESDPLAKVDAALRVVLETFASHRTLSRFFLVEALGAGAPCVCGWLARR